MVVGSTPCANPDTAHGACLTKIVIPSRAGHPRAAARDLCLRAPGQCAKVERLCHWPRYDLRTLSSFLTASEVPDITMRPVSST